MSRPALFDQVCQLIGDPPLNVLRIGSGWPGLVRIQQDQRLVDVALHVSTVSTHSRAPHERRFQNPGNRSPVRGDDDYLPILVGLAFKGVQPILVAVDGQSRLGREARFSILFHANLLDRAARDGWAEYQSTTGERIVALHPRLFPVFVEAVVSEAFPAAEGMMEASIASGLLDDDSEVAANRARRAASILIRSSRFARSVLRAYRYTCAMCGLKLGLVEGAHILPVSAPASTDSVSNGVALCRHHHALFDSHRLWVNPADFTIRWHPDVLATSRTDSMARSFVSTTQGALSPPHRATLAPSATMFERRYDFFAGRYDWLP